MCPKIKNMNIQEKVKNEIIIAMKEKNVMRRDNLKYLLGHFQNRSKNVDKSVNDADAIAIIKNILRGITDTQKMLPTESEQFKINENFISICYELLPKQATKEEIELFLTTFDYKSIGKQAIGKVIKHFNGNVDSNLVAALINN